MSRTDRVDAMQGHLKHVKKPDVDNLIKLYLDVLSGIAIEDDNCVSLGGAIKVYSHSPKTVIYIEETQRILSLNEIWEGTWSTKDS
jgi:Holliday junction resolvase RusA-like endonuclease